MLRIILQWAIALVLSLYFSPPTLARHLPVNLVPREVCVYDSLLLSFNEYSEDSVPFCKIELGISDVSTTVVVATSRRFGRYF